MASCNKAYCTWPAMVKLVSRGHWLVNLVQWKLNYLNTCVPASFQLSEFVYLYTKFRSATLIKHTLGIKILQFVHCYESFLL